jgi:protein-S-isoprenylcysteine O-methyltransferase Ste14
MNTRMKDHPNIVIFPPLIPLAILLAACALQWLAPLGLLANIGQGLRAGAGLAVAIAGIAITINGRLALVRRGTNVNPFQPSTALATGGIFRYTRNPMYVGVTLALAGIGIVFALDWVFLLLVPGLVTLHFGIVRREEEYLARKFGDEYRRFQARVPRYFGSGKRAVSTELQ